MTPVLRAPRWNDLDALRGFAMLLGIALHASLSFFPGFWVAVDRTADSDSWFDDFFHAVHGFRMPLFFLLSGFFTSMLWRRRGLTSSFGTASDESPCRLRYSCSLWDC